MNKLLTVLVSSMLLSLSTPAMAAHPLATEDSGTTGALKFQAEAGGEFGWDTDSANGVTTRTDSQTLNVCLTAGLLDPLDLMVSLPFSWQQIKEDGVSIYDHGGLNDVSLAIKWRFLETGPLSFAIKPAISFPSGDHSHGLGAAHPAYGATLISTIELKPLALHTNVGFTHQKHTAADTENVRGNVWSLALAGVYEAMPGLQVVAEIFTAENAHKSSQTWPAFITGGGIYSIVENLDFSLGVKGGLNSPATDIALLSGLTCRFP